LVANGAVRTHLIVVDRPSLAFSARLVEAEERVGVQAVWNLPFRLSIKALSVGLPGRLKSSVTPP
jgi:hypothetical protein